MIGQPTSGITHPEARREAQALFDRHDGHARDIVEHRLHERVRKGDVDGALKLDRVRRALEQFLPAE